MFVCTYCGGTAAGAIYYVNKMYYCQKCFHEFFGHPGLGDPFKRDLKRISKALQALKEELIQN